MGQVVPALLAGVSPNRVLLCDRYVRGKQNLEALHCFISALRAHSPQLRLDVWTGSEVDAGTIKTIADICGGVVSTYPEVFGASQPHDRYLVVSGSHEPPSCWQMSNSLLHARPMQAQPSDAQTRLRWRDFSALRLELLDLPQVFQGWTQGSTK